VLAVRKENVLPVAVTLALLAMYAPGQAQPPWKIFTNRAGWSISYPADWSIGSCRNCKDPTAPDVFVEFFPPAGRDSGGWVTVDHLRRKPSDSSVDEWLADISKTTNLSPRLSEERITLHGLPARKVRYSTGEGEREAVYTVFGLETFEIQFVTQKSAVLLEKSSNYDTYLKMLGTFRAMRP
jgi:hypothetical protein